MTNLTSAGATPENVASKATNNDVLDRSALNLLGVFGPTDALRALVRLPGGRVEQVKTGERHGWGRIVGIDAAGLMVLKNGQTTRIVMPR